MKLYIKQKVFSWGDKFRVTDENEAEHYSVQGKVFSVGKKLFVYDTFGQERAYIHQKVFSLMPKFYVSQNGVDVAEVKKKFSFLKPVYEISGPGWKVQGNFFEHDYNVTDENGAPVVTVRKKWLSWGDTYELDIAPAADELMAVCVVLCIDAVLASQNNATVSVSSN